MKHKYNLKILYQLKHLYGVKMSFLSRNATSK